MDEHRAPVGSFFSRRAKVQPWRALALACSLASMMHCFARFGLGEDNGGAAA